MIRHPLARLPLWVRLVAAVLLPVTAALTAISAVGVRVLHGELSARADAQLITMANSCAHRLVGQDAGGGSPAVCPGSAPVTGDTGLFRIERRDPDGKPVDETSPARATQAGLIPEDPAWLDQHAGRPMTVSTPTGDGTWRVLVQPLADAPGWIVVAMARGELNATISKLVEVNVTVGAVGLTLLAVAGIAIVRGSLRPLRKVEQTAAAIAAGDLSQRIPEHPPRTELGRLGRALNGMLAQIEEAFHARAASESTARRSEERMRRFVADAGHDLRTPLSVIRAWADHARQGPGRDRAELERILATVGAEATRVSTLVEDLLLLARLDQQRPLQRRPVDVLALALDAVRDARLLAPDRDIQLSMDHRVLYVVTGDETRLRQALSNLTGNALRHTPPGTPVSVTLGPGRLGRAPALVLQVADQGPGLDPEQAERVFERFYRTDASRARDTGGSGLGLAIVASLAAAHGGTASVHSTPGAGATFRLTLPVAEPAIPATDSATEPATGSG